MAVTKRGSKWHFAFCINGIRYRETTNAKNKREAQEIEAQAKASVLEARFEKRIKQKTFAEFSKTFLEWAQENKRSWHDDEKRIKILIEYFGKLPLDKISQFGIERFKRERLQTKTARNTERKPATVNRELQLLSKILSLAMERGLLDKNQARTVRKLSENNERYRYLTKEEETKLFDVLQDERFDRLRGVVTVALHTGMRKGELLKLEWKDIDFRQKSICIRSENSKTNKTRFVPMNETSFLTLLDLNLNDHKTESVFNLKCINRAWYEAIRKAEIDDFHFHDLRHTCATRLSALGADGFMIAEILGHSNLETTKRYAHAGDERKRNLLEKLKSFATDLPQQAKKNV